MVNIIENDWERAGKYFGYPKCCIKSFIDRVEAEEYKMPSRIQQKVCKGTGFVPCSYCAWKVLSKQCTLKDLIVNRKHRVPFPIK